MEILLLWDSSLWTRLQDAHVSFSHQLASLLYPHHPSITNKMLSLDQSLSWSSHPHSSSSITRNCAFWCLHSDSHLQPFDLSITWFCLYILLGAVWLYLLLNLGQALGVYHAPWYLSRLTHYLSDFCTFSLLLQVRKAYKDEWEKNKWVHWGKVWCFWGWPVWSFSQLLCSIFSSIILLTFNYFLLLCIGGLLPGLCGFKDRLCRLHRTHN